MRDKKTNTFLWLLFFALFALNICQSYYTELLPDEAYYWVYSQYLDWGFFDHPPMIAMFIKLSSFLFQGELGVRFISSLVWLATAYVVWLTVREIKKRDILLFLLLFISTPMLHVYGFITTPDTALILFIGLFLLGYQRYVRSKHLLNYVLLAVGAAGMIYSKYQGVLVIVCVLVSNPKLLRDGKLWLAGLFALLLLLPHILWQFENDFPSIRYHLFERVANRRYKLEHTLMHFVNMIAIMGLTFPIVYRVFFRNVKTKDLFKKALIYIVFGFFGLFFFSSFRGRVQAQWLVPICFSLIILTYHHFNSTQRSNKWLYILGTVNIVVLLIGRLAFASPEFSAVKLDTHGNKEWALKLKDRYPNTPKFFVNSYQNTASYWFYAKEKPYYYRNFTGRKNHFTLLQKESLTNYDSVVFANRGRTKRNQIAFKGTGKDSMYLETISNFYLPKDIRFDWIEEEPIKVSSKNEIIGRIINLSSSSIHTKNLYFEVGFRHKKQRNSLFYTAKVNMTDTILRPNDTEEIRLKFDIPLNNLEEYNAIGIGLKSTPHIEVFRISDLRMFTFIP